MPVTFVASFTDNARGGAFGQQHGHNLFGRAITEKLAQGFLMPGDVVLGHERQKIRRRIAAQGAAAEMRIFGEEVLRRRARVGEVAAPAAGDENLCAGLGIVVEQHHPLAPRARRDGTHETRRTGADYDDIKGRHGRWLACQAWNSANDERLSGDRDQLALAFRLHVWRRNDFAAGAGEHAVGREGDQNLGALAHLAQDADLAAMQVHQALHDGKAEARAVNGILGGQRAARK